MRRGSSIGARTCYERSASCLQRCAITHINILCNRFCENHNNADKQTSLILTLTLRTIVVYSYSWHCSFSGTSHVQCRALVRCVVLGLSLDLPPPPLPKKSAQTATTMCHKQSFHAMLRDDFSSRSFNDYSEVQFQSTIQLVINIETVKICLVNPTTLTSLQQPQRPPRHPPTIRTPSKPWHGMLHLLALCCLPVVVSRVAARSDDPPDAERCYRYYTSLDNSS